jgi:hypothetical protein
LSAFSFAGIAKISKNAGKETPFFKKNAAHAGFEGFSE